MQIDSLGEIYMACFIVPGGEAIVTTAMEKIMAKKNPAFAEKLGWLNRMLWSGSALLAFEHVWHGEVVPFFPFLTAVKNGEVSELLHEMATNGVSMAVLVTAVWGVMVGISSYKEKRTKDSASSNAATACNAAAGMTGSPA